MNRVGYERLAAVGEEGVAAVKRKWGRLYEVDEGTSTDDALFGIDLWFRSRRAWEGRAFPVQVKHDRRAKRSGNAFLELFCPTGPKGLLKSKAAVWIQVLDAERDEMLEWDVRALHRHFFKWLYRHGIVCSGETSTYGICVPLKELSLPEYRATWME